MLGAAFPLSSIEASLLTACILVISNIFVFLIAGLGGGIARVFPDNSATRIIDYDESSPDDCSILPIHNSVERCFKILVVV